jgi:hypothetical protein
MTQVESRSLSQVVEHAGAYAHLAAGAQRYGLHDGVAVFSPSANASRMFKAAEVKACRVRLM